MKPHLLIAESDPKVADLFHLFLTRQGFDVEVAAGGLECLEKLRRFPPDILIMSNDLPWGGSDGVLALMREEMDIPKVPVVLMGTDGASRQYASSAAAPVVQYLEKPFSLARLLDIVDESAPQKTVA
jgi:DNA-binding response OmpR family regulator